MVTARERSLDLGNQRRNGETGPGSSQSGGSVSELGQCSETIGWKDGEVLTFLEDIMRAVSCTDESWLSIIHCIVFFPASYSTCPTLDMAFGNVDEIATSRR